MVYKTLAFVTLLLFFRHVDLVSGADVSISTTRAATSISQAGTDQHLLASAITLLGNSRALLDRNTLKDNDRQIAESIYREQWALAIMLWRNDLDHGAKDELLKLWNAEWAKGQYSKLLTGALADAGGNRSFLNKNLLEFWRNAEDESSLNSMAYWIAREGSEDDVAFLRARIAQLTDAQKRGILENAISWHIYWNDTPRTDPGPAHMEPHPGDSSSKLRFILHVARSGMRYRSFFRRSFGKDILCWTCGRCVPLTERAS